MTRVFLSLGGNLGDRLAYLRAVAQSLNRGAWMELCSVSKVYETAPVEVSGDQPEYLNCVAELECGVSAVELLRYCQGVEAALGRERKGEKAPRTVDIDVLLFGDEVIESPALEVPHPGIERAFNLCGLSDLDDGIYIPGRGVVGELLAEADLGRSAGVRRSIALLMAVDVGNTQTVLGVFEYEKLRAHWRITTEASRTSDELGAVYTTLLQQRGLSCGDVDAVIVSSVVPGLVRAYEELARDVCEAPFRVVDGSMETGLKNRYETPSSVGADRIVNAVATGRRYGFPAVIVDIGTATTVEAVDGEANYLGGAILTGLNVALEALVSHTAKLPSVDLGGRAAARHRHQHPGFHPQRFLSTATRELWML